MILAVNGDQREQVLAKNITNEVIWEPVIHTQKLKNWISIIQYYDFRQNGYQEEKMEYNYSLVLC